jgi:putative ubiquitin-RnfH superfamily antitoxin RatB of RatAB toxin-antitoxin module
MANDQSLQITVVYSPAARDVREVALRLPVSSTVAQAIQASGLLSLFSAIRLQPGTVGVWGQKVNLNQILRDHDRVEIYRMLTVDPKVARRQRFVKQGARTTGLFTTQRVGGKAGY